MLPSLRRRLTFANVMSTLAVVIALGLSPAGAHVNSRFGHLWGSHIKPKLARPGTLNAAGNPVNWTKLKSVPSHVRNGHKAITKAPPGQHANETMTLNLPRGSYVIFAKAYAFTLGDGVHQVNCSLDAGADQDDTNTTVAKPSGSEFVNEVISQHVTHTFTSPGTVTFRCDTTSSVGVWNPRITALRVGGLTVQ